MTDLVAREPDPHALDLWRDLVDTGALTATGLRLVDPDLPVDTWESIGVYLGHIANVTRWAIGDWMIFGHSVYGDQADQGMDATGLAYDTLADYRRVCERIVPPRRRGNLSFSHHRAVAALEPNEQDHWLDRTIEGEWSSQRLRQELKDDARPELDGDEDGVPRGNDDPVTAAARAVWAQATKDGPVYRVPAEPMAQLAAAIGEGE